MKHCIWVLSYNGIRISKRLAQCNLTLDAAQRYVRYYLEQRVVWGWSVIPLNNGSGIVTNNGRMIAFLIV